jgi:RNA-directed DNA polymerase
MGETPGLPTVSMKLQSMAQQAKHYPAMVFNNVFHLIDQEFLLEASHQTHKSSAPGMDQVTAKQYAENVDENLHELHERLRDNRYVAPPVERVWIEKEDGKKRPRGKPCFEAKMVQRAVVMLLEAIVEPDFQAFSHGFRKGHSQHQALHEWREQCRKLNITWRVDAEVSGFFDTLDWGHLRAFIQQRVKDGGIVRLIGTWLHAGVLEAGALSYPDKGTPQGGVVSPLLANIYLHELDQYMEAKYLTIPKRVRQRQRAQGKANFLYVRYADDFIVLCNGRKEEAFQMKEELRTVLNQMGLTLSEEKTKVTHITEGFDFLGYRVIRSIGTRRKMIPKVLIPERAIKRFCHNIRRILAPNSTHESAMAKILAMNRFTRGWCEYYRCTNSPGVVFNQGRPEIFWGMAHWLGRKYKLSMPAVMRKYREVHTFRYKSATLIMPNEYKAKRFVARTWHNPYTEKDNARFAHFRRQIRDLISGGQKRGNFGQNLDQKVL